MTNRFRPEPGKFPPIEEAKPYRGELVFVDHVNRRGSLRLHVDGHYAEGRLHHFAMLPYGMIRYRGAPAELRDIPLGTVLYGRFYLPPDPETSAVPNVSGKDVTQPRENYAILLEDGPSLCLREGKTWQLLEVEIKGAVGKLVASLDRKEGGEGLGGEHNLTIDGSTRIWRGRELLGLADLVTDGTWPTDGKKSFEEQAVQLALTWHPALPLPGVPTSPISGWTKQHRASRPSANVDGTSATSACAGCRHGSTRSSTANSARPR